MGERLGERAITLYLRVFTNCLPVGLFEFDSVIVIQVFEGRETKVRYMHEFRILPEKNVFRDIGLEDTT